MSVRSSPSTENKEPEPSPGIPPSQIWQILGPGFPLGVCPLLPAPAIPSSLCRCPSKHQSRLRRTAGAQPDCRSKVPASGLSGPAEWGDAEVRPDPRVSSHSAGRAERTQAAPGHGLPRRGPLREGTRPPRSRAIADAPASPPLPAASPGTLHVAAGRSAGPTAGCPRGPAPRIPGQAARRLPARAHGSAPPRAARPGRRALARP